VDGGERVQSRDSRRASAHGRVAEGIPLEELLGNELGYGAWVADVLRPPEQDRGLYQLRLEEARSLICG
jgi:hypothetical protein